MSNYSPTILGILLSTTIILSGCHADSVEQVHPSVQSKSILEKVVNLSPKASDASQIKTDVIEPRADVSEIATTGEIKSDQERVFHINSLIPGRLIEDHVSLGDRISKGQTLALVQNLEVTRISGNYIHELHNNQLEIKQAEIKLGLARRNYERQQQLLKEGITSQKDFLQIQSEVQLHESNIGMLKEHAVHIKSEAKALLKAYGINIDEIEDETLAVASPILTPREGVIITKNVTVGDIITTTDPLYVVEDLRQVWLDITIYDKDLELIREGETVSFISDSLPAKTFLGRINYIKPSSESSKTFVARANLPNQMLLLKPGMFGAVKIVKLHSTSKPFVPEHAIQDLNDKKIAFLDLGHNRFKCREIEIDKKLPDGYLVKGGLAIGDRIATSGSFYLKAELLKDEVEK